MIRFWIDEIGLMLLDKEDFERFFFLEDKGFDEGLTEEEYEELIELNEKGKKQLLERIKKNEQNIKKG